MAKRSIDLHGKTVDQVDAIVDQFLHRAQEAGYESVQIMTGKGTGKIKTAVTRYLKLGNYPWSYLKTKDGSRNEGVLVVHLN